MTRADTMLPAGGAPHRSAQGAGAARAAALALTMVLVLGSATTTLAAPNATNATQKGSALIFPDIRVDREGRDWNTLIRVQNDGTADVTVTCYWLDGNKNRVDFAMVITRNQAVWFDARTGRGTHQINPFPQSLANGFDNPYLLTPPSLDEATDGPGLYLKGTLVCWATDAGRQNQIKWNHLAGTATIYHPQVGAYEYDAYAFFAPVGIDQEPVGVPGTLSLDGVFYDTCPLYQIGQFSPAPLCGNGIIVGTETCDDHNLVDGDGCSAVCQIEANFVCTGAPSVCTRVDVPPTAVADSATVNEDAGATAIDVLANDTDPDGGPKSIASVTQPANGTVVITGGGTGLTYQPNPNYCNTPPGTTPDTFTYTLTPGGSSVTVSIKVSCACNGAVLVQNWNGWTYWNVPVTGTMTDTNIAAACAACGMVPPCSGPPGCSYNDGLCAQTNNETSCGNPMLNMAQMLCGGSSPPNCPAVWGTYQYMGNNWLGGCGAESGSWCVVGSNQQNKSTLCVVQ